MRRSLVKELPVFGGAKGPRYRRQRHCDNPLHYSAACRLRIILHFCRNETPEDRWHTDGFQLVLCYLLFRSQCDPQIKKLFYPNLENALNSRWPGTFSGIADRLSDWIAMAMIHTPQNEWHSAPLTLSYLLIETGKRSVISRFCQREDLRVEPETKCEFALSKRLTCLAKQFT